MLDTLKPGQKITVTVAKAPRREDEIQTIERMMRQDPGVKRALKHAQEHRMRNLYVRSRGKRPWAVRRKSAKMSRAEQGASWSMTYAPLFANDLRSVEQYLDIKPA